ncbi:MAG: arginine repressor [Bacillota bacterium]|nr:arginine repressor [Bacillota bacterium]
MTSKAERQRRILEMVQSRVIATQEELAELLGKEGFPVTQATVSRDIRELQLVKLATGDGRYRYAPPQEAPSPARIDQLKRICRESILGYDSSCNMVVIQTLPATAASVAEAIDVLHFEEVLGTLAGERTVFVVVKPPEAADRFLARLADLIAGS